METLAYNSRETLNQDSESALSPSMLGQKELAWSSWRCSRVNDNNTMNERKRSVGKDRKRCKSSPCSQRAGEGGGIAGQPQNSLRSVLTSEESPACGLVCSPWMHVHAMQMWTRWCRRGHLCLKPEGSAEAGSLVILTSSP